MLRDKKKIQSLIIVIIIISGLHSLNSCSTKVSNDVLVDNLRCEYLSDPLGIDIRNPRLSWIIESNKRGQKQTGYQILLASSQKKLDKNVGDLWDTGKISSAQTLHVVYDGKKLESGMQCFWKLRIWDMDNKISEWSHAAMWSMGLLNKYDWKAEWIGYDSIPDENDIAVMPVRNFKHDPNAKTSFKEYLPSQYLRKVFSLDKKVSRASLYVTAQGHVEMHVNGKRVGNEYFTPGWTDYNKRIYYRTYDVTSMLKSGDNALGAILGDGWFKGNISIKGQNQYGERLRLLCQLQIDYEDGSSNTIVSDNSWKASFGPIILSDMFEGETYDARKEMPGWDMPDFIARNWNPVDTGSQIKPQIQAYPGVPVRPKQEMPTLKVSEPKSNIYVFDLGQNFSGWARLKVNGNAGDTINMQFAEMLKSDGTVYDDNLRSARAADNYILKGGGEEVFEPHFTFHGFRYVQLRGLTEKPHPDMITGIVIHSDAPLTSSFECSNPLLNQLHSNVIWGQRSNYLEVPTDCPQRDERLGWTGDTQVFIRSGCYNQDVSAFFTKWITDLMDTQNEEGTFGQQAPVFHGHGSPAWADAGVICPWTIYKVYGDKQILEKNYDSMSRFIEFCHNKGLTGRGGGFGDWLAVGSNTPKDLISAAYFAYTTGMMIEIADALEKNQDSDKFKIILEDIRNNFQNSFVNPDGTIAGDSQTAYCLAIYYDLLTEDQCIKAAEHLVGRIKDKNYHLSVGFLGVPILLPTLTKIGRSDLAYRLIQNTTYPSWGYSIKQGATTIWERWNSYTKENGFGDVGMNSFNHYAYGACSEWMFRSMLGIDTKEEAFKEIIMKPQFGYGVNWAKGHYTSIRGKIISDWKIEGDKFMWNIRIPANTTAEIHIPGQNIRENETPADKSMGVSHIDNENDCSVYKLESGNYSFQAEIDSDKLLN